MTQIIEEEKKLGRSIFKLLSSVFLQTLNLFGIYNKIKVLVV